MKARRLRLTSKGNGAAIHASIGTDGLVLSTRELANVTVYVPRELRGYCEGRAELALDAPSVRAALAELERRHPALYGSVCDETGAVRRHVNLFVNTKHVRDLQGMNTMLQSGDEIIILPAVSGG